MKPVWYVCAIDPHLAADSRAWAWLFLWQVVERDCEAPADLFIDARTAAVVLSQQSLAAAGSILEGLQQWVAQDLKKLSLCLEVCILVSIKASCARGNVLCFACLWPTRCSSVVQVA